MLMRPAVSVSPATLSGTITAVWRKISARSKGSTGGGVKRQYGLEANRRAFSYCRELGLKTIGASDAHTKGQIGKYATWLPEKVDCLKDFVEQLKTRQVRPAVWNGSSYDVSICYNRCRFFVDCFSDFSNCRFFALKL